MKLKLKAVIISCILAISLVGCATKTSTTPLPTGAINQSDATTYRVLADAHAFLLSIKNSVAAGTLILSVSQKKLFNDLIISSNTADALWQQYHAGQVAVLPQLTTATNNLNLALGNAQAQILVTP